MNDQSYGRASATLECDAVFTQRLRTNPVAFRMSHWENHFELLALTQYPEVTGKVLDFGCGSGHLDVLLARRGYTIHGVDLSPVAIAVAQYLRNLEDIRVAERLSFSVGDVTRNGSRGELFDSVWACHVFEHITCPGPILKGLAGWVKPFAPMLIAVPLGYAFDDPGHVHHFMTAAQLESHLQDHIKVVRVDVDQTNNALHALCRFQ